jgi:peptidoglycan/xylan/chitin deacetylase (PgdA/CDA1 family)
MMKHVTKRNIVEILSNGHEIVNHSHSHPHRFKEIHATAMKKEIEICLGNTALRGVRK